MVLKLCWICEMENVQLQETLFWTLLLVKILWIQHACREHMRISLQRIFDISLNRKVSIEPIEGSDPQSHALHQSHKRLKIYLI